LQSLITVALFIVLGFSAYFWRHNQLQKQSREQSIITNQKISSSKLGDLSIFKKITEDTKTLVLSNNMNEAKYRIADLEHEWDIAQAKLKPMDRVKWAEVDDAIDKVLRQLRTINPVQKNCVSSLVNLIAILK